MSLGMSKRENKFYQLTKAALQEMDLAHGENEVRLAIKHLQAVFDDGKNLNLTASQAEAELVHKHLADSLFLLKASNLSGRKVLDLGAGAGFPGLPLKIFCTDLKLTLLDARRRRINFLKYLVAEMQLKEVQCIHGRAEEIATQAGHSQRYSAVVARAVAPLAELLYLAAPLLKPGGSLFAYKGAKAATEIEAARQVLAEHKLRIAEEYSYQLASGEQRKIIIVSRET